MFNDAIINVQKIEDTVVSLSSSIAPARQHVYAKPGRRSRMCKNILSTRVVKAQYAVPPSTFKIYRMLQGVNRDLSMTAYISSFPTPTLTYR